MQTVYIGNTLINDVMLGAQRMDDVFTSLNPIQAEYLIVAAGGSGAQGFNSPTRSGGGGGAGGLLSGSLTILPYQIYTIQAGTNTGDISYPSYITGININLNAIGGGKAVRGGNGGSGGSGAGGAQVTSGTTTGGSGTPGQGFAGSGGTTTQAGGGGGAGGVGTLGITGGGPGKSSSISGTSTTYAIGGNGGNAGDQTILGAGGNGSTDSPSSPGAPGKGIVILRYFGTQKLSGGTVTTDGDYTIHTFTAPNIDSGTTGSLYQILYQ
jgi:hypothetical protein